MTLLPTLAGDVVVGDITLNTVDSDGTAWWMSDFIGWWGLPDVNIPSESRPVPYDGGYQLEGQYKPRVMTLTGGFRPASADLAGAMVRKLTDAIKFVHTPGVVAVQESDTWKMANVQLSGQPSISIIDSAGTGTFEIAFIAADPRKYEYYPQDFTIPLPENTFTAGLVPPLTPPLALPTSSTTASVFVNNIGNYDADFILTFYGAMTNPQLINSTTGQRMTFLVSITDGQKFIVDTSSHSAQLDGIGNVNFSLSNDSSWFSLPIGVSELRINALSSDDQAYAEIEFRSSWID